MSFNQANTNSAYACWKGCKRTANLAVWYFWCFFFFFFFNHWQKYLSGLRVEDQCLISFYVLTNLKPHNSILYLECTPPVLDLWVYQRQKRIKKQPRELCSSTYFISHSISRWLSNSSFWLIIVVASFELKEVTGCQMANWQTP